MTDIDDLRSVSLAAGWRAWPRKVIGVATVLVREPSRLLDDVWFWVSLVGAWLVLRPIEQAVREQDGVGPAVGWSITLFLFFLMLLALLGPECGLVRHVDRSARQAQAAEDRRDRNAVLVSGVAAGAAVLIWLGRPLLHQPVMLLYEYPLVTWIPVVAGLAAAGAAGALAHRLRGSRDAALQAAVAVRIPVTFVLWLAFMIMLPSWQGRALYLATSYVEVGDLPHDTEPRLLPKSAAIHDDSVKGMRHAHLVVDPASDRLVWTAEHRPGLIVRGASDAIVRLPLDRVDADVTRIGDGFHPAVARIGPGSIPWRAYKRHYFTRLRESVIVPLDGGGAVAVVPYVGYRGFPVRHPYWRGVYVYHEDGRLEDLTPAQALARPELRRSGRLFPEKLARDVAEAYGYRTGAAAVLAGRRTTHVADAPGNRQPYLTDLGDGQASWVTVAQDTEDLDSVAAIFMTDSATGRTEVWRPRPGTTFISNDRAARLARDVDLTWTECCDEDGDDYSVRKVTEPRPVFSAGRFYYLVSVVPDYANVDPDLPVEYTVLVDAEADRVERVFDHSDPESDDALRRFFSGRKV